MSSFASRPRRRLALSVGGALAAVLIAAPGAHAAFTLGPCAGGKAPGGGSSFQNAAFAGFTAYYSMEQPTGCGAGAGQLLSWNPSGSGAGRQALGEHRGTNTKGDRDPAYRWAGTDLPPTPTQAQQMSLGSLDANLQNDLTAADNSPVHVVPVAIGSVAILVHLPAGCTGFGTGNDLYHDRPKTALTDLEAIWNGDKTTWGDLIPNLTPADATCKGATIKRAVRHDGSGTSYALRQLLAQVSPAHAADWKGGADGTTWPKQATGSARRYRRATAARRWPTSCATPRARSATSISPPPATRARTSSTTPPPLRSTRCSGCRCRASTTDTGVYIDPQLQPDGYKVGNAVGKGANCAAVPPRNVPDDAGRRQDAR